MLLCVTSDYQSSCYRYEKKKKNVSVRRTRTTLGWKLLFVIGGLLNDRNETHVPYDAGDSITDGVVIPDEDSDCYCTYLY